MFRKDRRDGKRVKSGGFDRFLYYLKPRRSDSEVYISKDLDVTELVKYMKKKKVENEKMTYFHMFATAIAKALYNRPLMNRFIVNGNKYQRNDVVLSYVAKTDFSDDAREFMSLVTVADDDTLDTISKRISGEVKKVRNNEESGVDDFVNKLGKLPKFVMAFIVWLCKKLDNHDLLPKALTKGSLYHSSVIMSNLGSIHCDGIYHNLTNFGTNSILITMGEIKEVVKAVNGKSEIRFVCDFGITLDERIADGAYYAKSVNLLQEIFNHPEWLEDKVSDKIDINKSK